MALGRTIAAAFFFATIAKCDQWSAEDYPCVVCDKLVDMLLVNSSCVGPMCKHVPQDMLKDITVLTQPHIESTMMSHPEPSQSLRHKLTRSICLKVGLCKASKSIPSASDEVPNVRITPVFGAKGYDMIRVSLIDDSSNTHEPITVPQGLFTYSAPFKYRWTNMRLSSGLMRVSPGEALDLEIEGTKFTVELPKAASGVRGVIIADPCYSSEWVICTYGERLQTFDRIIGFINAASEKPKSEGGIDFWMILGDNFYDRTGELTQKFFSMLTAKAKSKIFAAAPGNHDYWVGGSPLIGCKEKDQFANGFMQYYAMDTSASRNDDVNFINFTSDPSKGGFVFAKGNLPVVDNFNTYFMIGDVAFISYSGAYGKSAVLPFFQEACQWVDSNESYLSRVYVIGHWNDANLGCMSGMEVPAVYETVSKIAGCDKLGDKLGYFMGHTHCNVVKKTNVGFMVAGMGMEGCGNFGVPVLDTTEDSKSVYYFPIQEADVSGSDKYNSTISCFMEKGVGGCKDMATTWRT